MRTPVHKPNDQMAGQLRNSPSPYSSPSTQSQENNRQLRDLLQQQPQQNPANTFRQPLPPGMIGRPQQRFMGPLSGPHPPPSSSSHHHQQQVKSVVTVQNTQIAATVAASESNMTNQIVSAQATSTTLSSTIVNTASNNEPMVGGIVASAQQSMGGEQVPPPTTSSSSASASTQQPPQQMGDNFIGNLETKLNHADLEKLEEVGDILGDLGEDDDDEFLKTFTADMGVDFNILEYAESEFDALDEAEQSNLLDSLDFDDTEEKDKSKRTKASENKAAAINQLKTNLQQHAEQSAAVAAAAAAVTTSSTMAASVTQTQTTLTNQPIASSQHHPRQSPSSQAQQQIMMQQRYENTLFSNEHSILWIPL